MKRAKREEQVIRTRLGRVIRDISRKIQGHDALKAIFTGDLLKVFRLQKQQRHSKEKVYSWHRSETECIGKVKAHKPYEFGCKVSITTHINPACGGHFILHIGALHQNPFDGHTLAPVLNSCQALYASTFMSIKDIKCMDTNINIAL